MSPTPSVVWFRHDLRLDDNPALQAAVQRGGPVIPVFIWAPEEEGDWAPGSASRWWLHQSLTSLEASLRQRGSRLVLRQGESLPTLEALVRDTGAEAVVWNRRYEPAIRARDARITSHLRGGGLYVESFNASLLFEPWEVHTRDRKPFQVFTPFWKACLALPELPPPLPEPSHLPSPHAWPASLALQHLALAPRHEWTAGIRAAWQPGEPGAAAHVARFVEAALSIYDSARQRLDVESSSRLSPHLHFGEISPRRLWHLLPEQALWHHTPGVEAFLRELGWREFAYHVLYHFPRTPDTPLREAFAVFPWRHDPPALRTWQRGKTGYPLVDAGMRELWTTGWMHNRVRMVVASFLVKDLLLPWHAGATWFWDTLVDADLANNTMGWQWTAGCGADAAPYFRIFNPVMQGHSCDPQGDYVRRWVPELAALPSAWIHHPWAAPVEILTAAGVELGRTYPAPMVDHHEARRRALAALATTRRGGHIRR